MDYVNSLSACCTWRRDCLSEALSCVHSNPNKTMKLTRTSLLLIAIGSAASVGANTISGGLWHVSEAASQNAVPANVPATPPDVSFSVDSPFNFSGTSTTVGNWLASSGAFNIVENTVGALGDLM